MKIITVFIPVGCAGTPSTCAALQCLNRCNEQQAACEARNAAQQEREVALRQQAEAREAAFREALDNTARELAGRYPGRAVVPAQLVSPDPNRPRLRSFAEVPDGQPLGRFAGGLFYGSGQQAFETEGASGQLLRVDLSTGQSRPPGIGRVSSIRELVLADGRRVLRVIEQHVSGTYVVHVLDPQGQPLVPGVDTGIAAYAEEYEAGRLPKQRAAARALWSTDHQGVLDVWVSRHLPVGKIRLNQPLDRKPLEALAIDLATGRVLQRRSFPKADALLLRRPTPADPAPGVRLYVATRSPAALAALDWESGSTL